MSKINILFISDLHFSEENKAVLKECSNLYIDKLSKLDDDIKPSIIAICGDIAFSGQEEEYKLFQEYFYDPLTKALGIRSDHVIAVPGNHDKLDSHCDKRLKNKIDWNTLESILPDRSGKDFEEDYRAEDILNFRLSRARSTFVLDKYAILPFKNYINFLKKICVTPFGTSIFTPSVLPNAENADEVSKDAAYLFGYRMLDGLEFYCFNSAWDCFHQIGSDESYLRIGPYPKVNEIKDNSLFTISMSHHPISWLTKEGIPSLYYDSYFIEKDRDIIVNGHTHVASLRRDSRGDKIYIELPTWSASDTDLNKWESYIIHIDSDSGKYTQTHLYWRRNVEGVGEVHHSTDDIDHPIRLRTAYEKERARREQYETGLLRILAEKLETLKIARTAELCSEIRNLLLIIKRDGQSLSYYKEIIDIVDMYYGKNSLEVEDAEMIESSINKILRRV